MTNSAVCSLPETGIGLSLVGVSVVLVLLGALLWRVPRVHRTRVMLAIAGPLTFLATTIQPAEATTSACPEQESGLNRVDPNPVIPSTSDPSPSTSTPTSSSSTTSTPEGPTPYNVTITGRNTLQVRATGAGLTGSGTADPNSTYVYRGTLAVSSPDPVIEIRGKLVSSPTDASSAYYNHSSLPVSGGTCKDNNDVPLDKDNQMVALPLSCTITGDFSLSLDGDV